MTLIFVKLPEKEQTADRRHAYSHIECNVCGARAPSPREMTTNLGLRGEGWAVRGGVHLCPDHVDTLDPQPKPPEYRAK